MWDREVVLTLAYAAVLTAFGCGLAGWARRIDTAAAKAPDTWPQSQDAQFRRGIALAVLALALVLLSAQMARHRHAAAIILLSVFLLVDLGCAWRIGKAFRGAATPLR
ncbi:MAG: hypothetical protein ABJB12_04135 [Pseudomonadota bacterium]